MKMIKETKICDRCQKEIALITCDLCGCDLCDSCKSIQQIRIWNSCITKLSTCVKCTPMWDGELSVDMRDLIISRIKARKILNKIEEEPQRVPLTFRTFAKK